MIIFLIGIAILIFLVFKGQKKVIKKTGYIPTDDNLDKIQSEFLSLLNEHRELLGLKPLVPESLMGTLAVKRITEINK
jgi:hypothetical protein